MKSLKIDFTDFWPGFKKDDNFIYETLSKEYNLIISEKPDVLFFSCYSSNYQKYNCKRIQFIGENIRPNFYVTDYAISFDLIDSNQHLRLPLYAIDFDKKYPLNALLQLPDKDKAHKIFKSKTKFCAFIVNNPSCEERNKFFDELSLYKKVDSVGSYRNNLGFYLNAANFHDYDAKREFINQYKFVIAFENVSFPGYVTEKILHPKQSNAIPIYWGSPSVGDELNSKSFLNFHDYNSFEQLIAKTIELDKNDDKYIEMLMQPFFHDNTLNKYCSKERFSEFLFNAVESNKKPVANSIINIMKTNKTLKKLKNEVYKFINKV